MSDTATFTYHSCAVATDGGSSGLALVDPGGGIVHFTIDRSIGTDTVERILFMDKSPMGNADLQRWLPVLQRILDGTDFPTDLEREIVQEFISLMENQLSM